VHALNKAKVGTRLLFAGNLTKQPAYKEVQYRVASELDVADTIMNDVLWVGTYPGIGEDELQYVAGIIEKSAAAAVA
jgi:CDP-6-deoxy-D-xylo-4-hexulose-3-dehydrase